MNPLKNSITGLTGIDSEAMWAEIHTGRRNRGGDFTLETLLIFIHALMQRRSLRSQCALHLVPPKLLPMPMIKYYSNFNLRRQKRLAFLTNTKAQRSFQFSAVRNGCHCVSQMI